MFYYNKNKFGWPKYYFQLCPWWSPIGKFIWVCNLATVVQISLLICFRGDYILEHVLYIFWGKLSGPAIVSAFSNRSVLKMNPVMFKVLMLNCNHFSCTKLHISGFSLGNWKRKYPGGLGLKQPIFCFELFICEMMNLVENIGHSLILVTPAFIWCLSLLLMATILHWQGRIPLFLKSNAVPMGEKRPPNKKHEKDRGKIIKKANVDNFQLPSSSETQHHRGGPHYKQVGFQKLSIRWHAFSHSTISTCTTVYWAPAWYLENQEEMSLLASAMRVLSKFHSL